MVTKAENYVDYAAAVVAEKTAVAYFDLLEYRDQLRKSSAVSYGSGLASKELLGHKIAEEGEEGAAHSIQSRKVVSGALRMKADYFEGATRAEKELDLNFVERKASHEVLSSYSYQKDAAVASDPLLRISTYISRVRVLVAERGCRKLVEYCVSS